MISTDQIRTLPEYIALTRARNRFIWPVSALVIITYFALIMAIAFNPQALGIAIGDGVTSLGVVLGLGIILFCLLVTGVYVYYANHVLEPLSRAIAQKVESMQ